MSRSFLFATLAVAMTAGFVRADEEFHFSGSTTGPSDYVAGSDIIDGNCPTGHAGHLGHHGHHGRHGFHLHGAGAAAGATLAGYYPNNINNYGQPGSLCEYRGAGGCRTCGVGDCSYRWYGQPDLFYNYYAWPQCSGVGAELYISPRPVPPHVGHTFITYQPLYPHEFMYSHHRTYHRYYNGGQGLNRTHVKYVAPWFRN